MRQLVKYAHMRGVAVMPEFDTPAHSKAMCSGVPDAYVGICMDTCEPYSDTKNYPLRPIKATFTFLKVGPWVRGFVGRRLGASGVAQFGCACVCASRAMVRPGRSLLFIRSLVRIRSFARSLVRSLIHRLEYTTPKPPPSPLAPHLSPLGLSLTPLGLSLTPLGLSLTPLGLSLTLRSFSPSS